jgi:hypothetical protein
MTVKQLKFLLRGVPDTYRVMMSSDPEGNSFSDLYEGSLETFLAGETEPDYDATGEEPNVLLLWPRE